MDFGKLIFEGKEITVTSQADFTNRCLTDWETEEGYAEFKAHGVDEKGNLVAVYWKLKSMEVEDLTDLDWDIADRVERLY